MDVIGRLIERLQRWFARYRTEVTYAEAIDRRRQSLAEIEWNGATIGDVSDVARRLALTESPKRGCPETRISELLRVRKKNGSWLMSLS